MKKLLEALKTMTIPGGVMTGLGGDRHKNSYSAKSRRLALKLRKKAEANLKKVDPLYMSYKGRLARILFRLPFGLVVVSLESKEEAERWRKLG